MTIKFGKAEEMLQGLRSFLRIDDPVPNKIGYTVSNNFIRLKQKCDPYFQMLEEKRLGFHEKYKKGKAQKNQHQAELDFLKYKKELSVEDIEIEGLEKINIEFLNTDKYKNTILPKDFFVTCFDLIEGEIK